MINIFEKFRKMSPLSKDLLCHAKQVLMGGRTTDGRPESIMPSSPTVSGGTRSDWRSLQRSHKGQPEQTTTCRSMTFTDRMSCPSMGVDHGGAGGGQVPQNLERGIVPQILSCCKILSTRLLALQCRKMCFFASTAVPPEFQSSQCALAVIKSTASTSKYWRQHSCNRMNYFL